MASYRYWRLVMQYADAGQWSAATIKMKASAGGSNLATTGGNASSSGELGGYEASKAVDGNASTFWVSNTSSSGAWWKYDFGSAVDILEIEWTARNDGYAAEAPRYAIVQGSTDNSTWVDEWSIIADVWTNGATQTFTRQVAQDPGGHRYWRIYTTGAQAANDAVGGNVELRRTVGGSTFSKNCIVTADNIVASSFHQTRAIDDAGVSTFWASGAAGSVHYIAFDFGASSYPRIDQVMWTARNDGLHQESPSDGEIQYSDDGTNWSTAWTYTGLTWTSGQTQPLGTAPVYGAGGAGARIIWFD